MCRSLCHPTNENELVFSEANACGLHSGVLCRHAKFEKASPDCKFAAAVAEFGMLLRNSEYKGNGTIGSIFEWAVEGKGIDSEWVLRGIYSTR